MQHLKKNISDLTLKQSLDIRWENRTDAVQPLKYQLGEIYTFHEIMENKKYTKEIQYEARSLYAIIKSFKFIFLLVF